MIAASAIGCLQQPSAEPCSARMQCVAGGNLLRFGPPAFNITNYQIPKRCTVACRSPEVAGRYDGKLSGNLDDGPIVGSALPEAAV